MTALILCLRTSVQKIVILVEEGYWNPLVHVQKAKIDLETGIANRVIRVHDVDHLRGGGIDLDGEQSIPGIKKRSCSRRADIVEPARGKWPICQIDKRGGLRLQPCACHYQAG